MDEIQMLKEIYAEGVKEGILEGSPTNGAKNDTGSEKRNAY